MATKTTQQTTESARKPVGQNVSATRRVARLRRHARLRKQIEGTAEMPRLVVNRSSRHIHVQLVNDLTGTTVAAASSIEADVRAVDGDKKAHSVRGGPVRPRGLHLRWPHRGAGRRRARRRAEVLIGLGVPPLAGRA